MRGKWRGCATRGPHSYLGNRSAAEIACLISSFSGRQISPGGGPGQPGQRGGGRPPPWSPTRSQQKGSPVCQPPLFPSASSVAVVEENEPESVKLSKIAGGTHFDEGPRRRWGIVGVGGWASRNVDREGQSSDPETPPRRRLQARPGQAVSGLERVQSLMAASAMARAEQGLHG